jgi:hypothetical protein
MRFPLASIRKGVLAPTLAVAMSLVLVLGQVFHCCRLNESVSGSLEAVFRTLVVSSNAAQAAPGVVPAGLSGDAAPGIRHQGCHGHATVEESSVLTAGYGEGPWMDADRSCLSESRLSSRIDQPPAPEFAITISQSSLPATQAVVLSPAFPAPSVPEIQGGPPLYLRTQRLLV